MAGSVRARRKAERPSEILEAAFEEFRLHGYAATRLEDVAARAGITKGTIYVYFENKEKVFEALARARGEEFFERIRAFRETDSEPTAESIRADLTFLFRTLSEDRGLLELLRLAIAEAVRFPKLIDDQFQNFFAPVLDKMKERMQLAAVRGELRDMQAVELPELLMAPAMMIHIWQLLFADRRPLDVERYIEAAVDLIMNGLLPDGPGRTALSSDKRHK